MDSNTTVSALRQRVERFRDERDWRKFHNPKDLSIALTIESSELEEAFLWKDKAEVELLSRDRTQLERVAEEMADIAIYLLSLSSVLKVDLSEAIGRKLVQNERKYPVDKSKGSSKKYNEL